jgi:hypothetical protein
MLSEKSEDFISDNHFYVFVGLGGIQERPSYHIVPSRVVAERISTGHKKWLRTLRRDGQKHTDTPMRKLSDPKDEFLERWDLLGL